MDDEKGVIKITGIKGNKPLDVLSNNYKYPLNIDGKIYNTITNYILSNLMYTPINKLILQASNIEGSGKNVDMISMEKRLKAIVDKIEKYQNIILSKEEKRKIKDQLYSEVEVENLNIFQLYKKLRKDEVNNIYKTCIKKGFNQLIKNGDILTLLLNTGNDNIIYISSNDYLGVNEDTLEGYNMVGKILMQIRQENMAKTKEESKNIKDEKMAELVFNTYIFDKILEYDIDNLQQYENTNTETCVDKFKELNPDLTLEKIGIYEDTKPLIYQLYRKGLLPNIANEIREPGSLYREYLDKLEKRRLNKEHLDIIDGYVEYIIREKYSNLEDEDIIDNAILQFHTDFTRMESIRNRDHVKLKEEILRRYYENDLPEEAVKLIKNRLGSSESEDRDGSSSSESKNTIEMKFGVGENEEEVRVGTWVMKNIKAKTDLPEKNIFYKFSSQPINYTSGSRPSSKDINKALEKIKKKIQRLNEEYAIQIQDRNDKIEKYFRELSSGNKNVKKPDWNFSFLPEPYATIRSITPDGELKKSQYSIVFVSEKLPDNVPVQEAEDDAEEKEEKKEEKINTISIYLDDQEKNTLYKPFGLLDKRDVVIDNIRYPSIAMYMYAILVSTQGVRTDIRKSHIFKRGMNINKAVELLKVNGEFVSIFDAKSIYENLEKETDKKLTRILFEIGAENKFKIPLFKSVLLSTENSKLVWEDDNIPYLSYDNKGGKILSSIRKKYKKEKSYTLTKVNIDLFIQQDEFMNSWIDMRITDLCNIITNIYRYFKNNKVEVNFDDEFIENVLSSVYHPCNMVIEMLDDIDDDILTPESVKTAVYNSDITEILTEGKNYKKLINELYDEYFKYQDQFFGIKSETSETKDEFYKRYNKEFNELVRKGSSESEIKRFEETKDEEFRQKFMTYEESVNKPRLDIVNPFIGRDLNRLDRRQREEWEKFIRKRLGGDSKEIEKLLKKKISSFKEKKGRKPTKEEREKMMEKITDKLEASVASSNLNEDIENFLENQREERRRVLGSDIDTEEAKKKYEEYAKGLKGYQSKLSTLMIEKRKMDYVLKLTINQFSNILWKRLYLVIYFLIVNNKSLSAKDLTAQIVKSELLFSKESKCKKTYLSDPKQNCIASAMINILSGMSKMKSHYADDLKMNKSEIDLVYAIICNKKVATYVEEKNELEELERALGVYEEPEHVPKYEEEKEEKEESEEEERSVSEDEDRESDDYGEDEDDYEKYLQEEEDRSEGEMNFSSEKDKLKITKAINDIQKVDEDIITYFDRVLNNILMAKMPNTVKLNRINFFARQ